ncbi:HNH endonuclease [Pirellula sp. SH-Sr6A]|uniref:HNH endonuclease n=1 Tax=Pirellula sp. SH-Sr6A TaxID=1632865 RepID=UPI00078C5500|nr:HNH endonuclease signature motif containing protein [Pirellula sp. SH-Sr6A]AMV31762.1 HNH endonuclease [Pirellula sp. SH-Sr6A]
MSRMKALFQKAWTAVTNPGQDERVAHLVMLIGRELQTKKQAFKLEEITNSFDCLPKEIALAAKQYYEKLLTNYWSDGVPKVEKQQILAFIAKRLKLDADIVDRLNIEVAMVYFGAQLGEFLEDGIITDEELAILEATSRAVNRSVPQLVSEQLASSSVGILRGLFANAIEDGYLEPQVWNNLVASAQRLGISVEQLQKAVQPIVTGFAEHVLADAKSDNALDSDEESYLKWILETFEFEPSYSQYFAKEIESLRERTRIAAGEVEPIPIPPGVHLRSGEILYFCEEAVAGIERHRQSGSTINHHAGRLLLTEGRLIFDSATKSMSFPYKSIVSWKAGEDFLLAQVTNKPQVMFVIPEGNEHFLNEKFRVIIQMYSRVLRKRVEGQIDRHIPHDIRQRVWQRYGGKCVECGATEYLEFDHIIPVSKGGSNSEQNVQLLCRKCNLAKSNHI